MGMCSFSRNWFPTLAIPFDTSVRQQQFWNSKVFHTIRHHFYLGCVAREMSYIFLSLCFHTFPSPFLYVLVCILQFSTSSSTRLWRNRTSFYMFLCSCFYARVLPPSLPLNFVGKNVGGSWVATQLQPSLVSSDRAMSASSPELMGSEDDEHCLCLHCMPESGLMLYNRPWSAGSMAVSRR